MDKEITFVGKTLLPILLAAGFVALLAQVSIDLPWHDLNIPITGQSLAVLLVGYWLGKHNGALAILLYLLAGVLGLPVFAHYASGWNVLTGGSGGFLYGFVLAAWLMGYFRSWEWGKKPLMALAAMTLGTAVILFFGLLQLTYLYGFPKALEYGWFPFWRGALVKIILGAILLLIGHRWKTAS